MSTGGGVRSRLSAPWQAGRSHAAEGVLPASFFRRDAVVVARSLLGCRLVSSLGGHVVSGVIVETEAYLGPEDAASHACTRRGPTPRNRAMFGPGGRAYVYRSYGVHWCLNVVSGEDGDPQAVLLRGLEPLSGTECMARRRGGRSPLAAGPGRLCQALGVTGELYGRSFALPPLELRSGWALPDEAVAASGRIGVTAAADRPFRFFVRGSPGVSAAPR